MPSPNPAAPSAAQADQGLGALRAITLPKEHGGLGLASWGCALLFREMGESPIGAACFNCDGPNQANRTSCSVASLPSCVRSAGRSLGENH